MEKTQVHYSLAMMTEKLTLKPPAKLLHLAQGAMVLR
jgi:hypothetical protein